MNKQAVKQKAIEAMEAARPRILALDMIGLLWGDGDGSHARAAEKPLLIRNAYRRRFD